MKNLIIQYILKRLTEASTIRGIILGVSSAFGLVLTQDQTNSAVWIVLGIVGILGSLLPDYFNRTIQKNVPSSTDITVDQQAQSDIPTPPYTEEQAPTETGWGDK